MSAERYMQKYRRYLHDENEHIRRSKAVRQSDFASRIYTNLYNPRYRGVVPVSSYRYTTFLLGIIMQLRRCDG